MSSAIHKFLKGQDQLGSTVNLKYRNQPSYGTLLGGCISLLTTLFFFTLICLQLYAWLFQPSYDQLLGVSYLKPDSKEIYTVSVMKYLPTFVLQSGGDAEKGERSWNDSTLNTWTWSQGTDIHNRTILSTVPCQDLINSWTYLPEAERAIYLNELPYPFSLCPNITEFSVRGRILGDEWLELSI